MKTNEGSKNMLELFKESVGMITSSKMYFSLSQNILMPFRSTDRPIYIGCAGKISKEGELNGNTIKNRMFSANTPYHFSKTSDDYFFGPTTATVPPKGYDSEYPMKDLIIKLIIITNNTAPTALEHILLQGFINEYASQPEANQKL